MSDAKRWPLFVGVEKEKTDQTALRRDEFRDASRPLCPKPLGQCAEERAFVNYVESIAAQGLAEKILESYAAAKLSKQLLCARHSSWRKINRCDGPAVFSEKSHLMRGSAARDENFPLCRMLCDVFNQRLRHTALIPWRYGSIKTRIPESRGSGIMFGKRRRNRGSQW